MKCQRVIARSKVYVKFKRYLCQNHSRTKMVNSTFCKLLNFFSIFTNVFKEIKFKHKFPPLIKYSIYIYICFYTLHAFWISTLPNAPRLFAFQYSLLKKRTISNTKVKKKSVIDHLPLLFDLDSMWFLNGSINIVSVAQVCAPLLIYSYRARHRCRYTKKRQRKRKKNRKHRGEQNVGKRKKVEDGQACRGGRGWRSLAEHGHVSKQFYTDSSFETRVRQPIWNRSAGTRQVRAATDNFIVEIVPRPLFYLRLLYSFSVT